jgi:hypothetical protein
MNNDFGFLRIPRISIAGEQQKKLLAFFLVSLFHRPIIPANHCQLIERSE